MPVSRQSVRIDVVQRRGRELLQALTSARDAGVPTAAVCDRASAAVDHFSAMLAQHLATVAHSMSYASAERLSRQYLEVLAEFGVALRDLVPDPEARHRLAQEIQIAILRHERRLREALAPAIQK